MAKIKRTCSKNTPFCRLQNKLAKNPKDTNPAAVAAAIGRRKLGQAEMTRRSVAGRRKG